MNDDSQQTNQDRFDKEDAILPGLGIVVGILIGVFLWEFVVEGWITLGPAGLWVAEGCLYAVCVLVVSMIDGLIRPWRNRIRSTVVLAVGIVALWGSAALGYAIAGEPAAAVGWLLAFLVFVVMGWALRKGRYRHPNPRRSDTHD